MIKKAVIPAAGLGTRFLPATKAQPKEMLPIVDKPTIQYIVEEAIDSGIESILIITGRGKRAIEDHFDKSYELEVELEKSRKRGLLTVVEDISNMIEVHYTRQKEAKGLGHAIRCAKTFVGNEPFAVMLGDDVVYSDKPVIGQMIEVYEQYKAAIVGVQRVAKEEVNKYGIVDIKGERVNGQLARVFDLVEKPPIDEAPSNIAIMGRYILSPEIFDILDHTQPGKSGEIQLTDAIKSMAMQTDVYAYEFDGIRYDVGNKIGFLQANIEYALRKDELSEEFKRYLSRLTESF